MTPEAEIIGIFKAQKLDRKDVSKTALRNFLNHWWMNRVRLGMPTFDALVNQIPDNHDRVNFRHAVETKLSQSTLELYKIVEPATPKPVPEPEVELDPFAFRRRFWQDMKDSDAVLTAQEFRIMFHTLKQDDMNLADWAVIAPMNYESLVAQAQATELTNLELIEMGLMPRAVDVVPEPEPEPTFTVENDAEYHAVMMVRDILKNVTPVK